MRNFILCWMCLLPVGSLEKSEMPEHNLDGGVACHLSETFSNLHVAYIKRANH